MKHAIALGALAIAAGAASTAEGEPFDWTGFYIGAHAGYGVGQEHDNQSQLFPVSSGPGGTTAVTSTGTPSIVPDQYDLNGFVGGVHAGYNYQLERYVLGIEGDLDYSGLAGSADGVYLSGATNLRHLSFESRWQGTLRVRAGFTPLDRLLLYAAGGVAIAEGRLSNSGTNNSSPILSTSSTNTHIGWTAGLGADYAFTTHWIGQVEVRYSDFGSQTYPTDDGPVKVDWDQWVGLIGISYKF